MEIGSDRFDTELVVLSFYGVRGDDERCIYSDIREFKVISFLRDEDREALNLTIIQSVRPGWHPARRESFSDALSDLRSGIAVSQIHTDQWCAQRGAFEVLSVASATFFLIERVERIRLDEVLHELVTPDGNTDQQRRR